MNYSLYKTKFLLFFIFLSGLIRGENTFLKETKNQRNITNSAKNIENIQKDKKYFKNNSNRNLEETEVFTTLNIYLDLTDFDNEIPSNIQAYKDIIISSMKKAKKTLESLLEIKDYNLVEQITEEDLSSFQLENYNKSLFKKDPNFEPPKYDLVYQKEKIHMLIFYKFNEIVEGENSIVSAKILRKTSKNNSDIGILIFNKNMDISKLTSNYLDPLMLHLFTHLLGFILILIMLY